MSNIAKKTFYPSQEVDLLLREVPRGKFSERINTLILKGLSYEKQESIRLSYEKYNDELSPSEKREQVQGVSTMMMMSKKAFEVEDEEEDFF